MKFDKYKLISAIYVLLTSFSTTITFYYLGLFPFLGISIVYFMVGWYLSYFSMKKFNHDFQKIFKNFHSKKFFQSPHKVLLLFAIILISLVSIVFLFVGNLAYTIAFFADSLNISVSFLLPLLCCLFVPISLFNLVNNCKDMYFYITNFLAGSRKFQLRKLLVFFSVIPIAIYLSLGLVKLSIIGLQMYELTVLNTSLVHPVATFIQVILFTFSFIMLSGLLCKIINYAIDKTCSGEGFKLNDLVNLGICAVGVSITSISGFAKGGENSSAYASAAQSVWSAAEAGQKLEEGEDVQQKISCCT